jgi:hypothetical protein
MAPRCFRSSCQADDFVGAGKLHITIGRVPSPELKTNHTEFTASTDDAGSASIVSSSRTVPISVARSVQELIEAGLVLVDDRVAKGPRTAFGPANASRSKFGLARRCVLKLSPSPWTYSTKTDDVIAVKQARQA